MGLLVRDNKADENNSLTGSPSKAYGNDAIFLLPFPICLQRS